MKDRLPGSPPSNVAVQQAANTRLAPLWAKAAVRLRAAMPSAGTWLAVAGGAFVAALFIAWPAVARWTRGPKETVEPAPALVAAIAAADPETPEPVDSSRAEIVRSVEALDPADVAEPRYPEGAAEKGSGFRIQGSVGKIADARLEPAAALVEHFPVVEVPPDAPNQPPPVISLSADDPAFDFATLSPGQTVRGDPDRRPVLEVPPGGLVVSADQIVFENIDFIAAESAAGEAMITLRGSGVLFDTCSFAAADGSAAENLPMAISWFCETADGQTGAAALSVRNSSFEQVAAAVSCRINHAARCQIGNVLHLGPGSLVAIDRPPERDEQFGLTLSHVTVRGAKAVVTIGCQQLPGALGSLDVEAADCAFALRSAAALLVYDSAVRPGRLLAALRWTGQGSVLSGRARMAMWRMPEGRLLATRDDAAPIAGVIRGEITFAASPNEGWAGSQIARCDAALDASRRPGIQ